MSVAASLRRQWIPIAGGSCDVRFGYGALDAASTLFKTAVGSPRMCMAVLREDTNEDLVESLRRQLVNAGYEVCWYRMGKDAPRSLEEAAGLANAFAQAGITGDDLCCALGDADAMSVASYVCGSWCGGVSLVAVPTDEIAFLEGALVPNALEVAGKPMMLSVRPSVRHVLLDLDLALSEPGSETSLYARALMVAAAMAGSERVFSELWDRADAIASGDEGVTVDQLLATAKSRGQTVSSNAVAVRQSLDYGRAFAHALQGIADTQLNGSALLAEAFRFCARIAVGLEKVSIDDMLAQDELLDALGIGTVACDIAPEALVAALKDELFLRSNRFMLLVPFGIGRVRLATIPDELLVEHATAWCAAHSTQQ